MSPALLRRARLTAAGIALVALTSVGLQFVYLNGLRGQTYPETAWDMARFFTILTNLLVAWTWARAAARRGGVHPPWLAALTVSVVMAGAVYHVLLSHLVDFDGIGWWADHGLHSAVPLACLLWWLAFAPKRGLTYRDVPIFALWPAIYAVHALTRGAVDGRYPYPFMDIGEIGAAAVAVNLAGLALALLSSGIVMVAIGRHADRQSRPGSSSR